MKLKLALASIALAATLSAAPASATTYGGGFGGFGDWGGGFGGGFGGFGNWGNGWGNWGGGGDCGIILRLIGNCGGGGGWHHGGGGGWHPGDDGDPSPVPLPAALPLLIGGLAVAGAVSTRRKKSKSV